MSFRYKGVSVTLENYKTIYADCSPDVLDEIRSAVLDDTPLAPYIIRCRDDSYKLGQIRLALREMIPIDFINVAMTAKTINIIRNGFSFGVGMTPILRYIRKNGLTVEAQTLEVLAQFLYLGTNIDRVDFTKVPCRLVEDFCRGLYKGYPMWLLEGNLSLDEKKLGAIMKAMALGVDVSLFLDSSYDTELIQSILLAVEPIMINDFLSLISPRFSEEMIGLLGEAMKKGLSIHKLCRKDTAGYPIYNIYQMQTIICALEAGTMVEEAYNPMLSDVQMERLISS